MIIFSTFQYNCNFVNMCRNANKSRRVATTMNSFIIQDQWNLQSFIFRFIPLNILLLLYWCEVRNLWKSHFCMLFFVQLRNLVWATSKHDVYLMSNYSIMHWSSLSQNLTEILNFSGHVAPTEVLYLIITF